MEALVGKKFKFYGVWNECFKLGSKIYQAYEDPDDGYRSYLGSIEVVDKTDRMVFARASLGEVVVAEDDYLDGFKLVDTNTGHTWLAVGTDHSCNYYPYFVFNYTPKKV
jgi:hypothetical protein